MTKNFEDNVVRFFVKNCPNELDIIDNLKDLNDAIIKYFSKTKIGKDDKFLLTINTNLGAIILRMSSGKAPTKVTKIVKEFKGCMYDDDLDLKGTWEEFINESKS